MRANRSNTSRYTRSSSPGERVIDIADSRAITATTRPPTRTGIAVTRIRSPSHAESTSSCSTRADPAARATTGRWDALTRRPTTSSRNSVWPVLGRTWFTTTNDRSAAPGASGSCT